MRAVAAPKKRTGAESELVRNRSHDVVAVTATVVSNACDFVLIICETM
jgi:hypothetical protein